MSVITTYYVVMDGIKSKLIQGGYIHPDTLHNKRNEQIKKPFVLDYILCNKEMATELKKEYQKEGYMKHENGHYIRKHFEGWQLDELLKYPVVFYDDNTLVWSSNYFFNDTPLKFIKNLFPYEKLNFKVRYSDGSIYRKII